jgi:DNA-binding NtrC family response regulator
LQEEIAARRFREDLYYRLNVVSLEAPPLRERPEDIPLLAAHFLTNCAPTRRVRGVSPEALQCLTRYSWPGNVREMQHAIERAIVLGNSEWILPDDLPEVVLTSAPPEVVSGSFHEEIARTKKQLIRSAIERANGDQREAARLLGIHWTHLYRLIRALNLRD